MAALLGLSAALVGLPAGCASLPELPWAPVAKDASAGFYQKARIEYQVDAGKLGVPLDVARVEGQRVRYEQVASSPAPEHSLGTLVIQNPHPRGHAGVALVTFSLDSDPTTKTSNWNLWPGEPKKAGVNEEVHELWAMDLPLAEVERYFTLLSQQNFHGRAARPNGSAKLSVTIDGRSEEKTWEQVPELNLLVQYIRQHGQLVAYARPGTLGENAPNPIASTKAYRDVLAQTGRPEGSSASPRSLSAFTVPSDTNVARLPYGAR